MDFSRFKAFALSCAAAAVFVGCGGGDTSTATATPTSSLSGTAAGGAAIIGNVLIKDSLGATKGGTIDSTGHYNVDVSGMTGPFLLRAKGTVGDTTVTYCSAATSADVGGTINITPFTNLILSNLVQQIAENYFTSSNPTSAMISATAITAQETALQSKLQPILAQLGIDSAIDLLRSSFSADHSGLDAVMDLVKVEFTGNTATIKNAITQAVMSTDNVATNTDDSTVVSSGTYTELNAAAATDLQLITTQMNNFAKLFATTTPSVDTMATSGLFDTSSAFMDMGQSFDEFATELSTDQSLIGFSFSNINILLDSATTGTLTASIHFKNTTFTEQISLKVIKIGGVWKVIGDQTIADIEFNVQAIYSKNTGTIVNGLNVSIDPFAYNASHASAMVTSALITGPGLDANGINSLNSHIPECSGTNTPCVSFPDVKDGSVYRIQLYTGTTLLADYNRTLPKAPVTTSMLTASSFPTITSFLVNGTAWTSTTFPQIVAGNTIGFTWTLPASLRSDYISASAWGISSEYYRLQKDLLPAETQATFALGSTDINTNAGTTVSSGGVWLSARDEFHRQFVYNSWF